MEGGTQVSAEPCQCCGGSGWSGCDCSSVEAELERTIADRDEALKRIGNVSRLGVDLLIEREDLRKEIAAERALADRLAGVLFGCTEKDQNDAYVAWKEARK